MMDNVRKEIISNAKAQAKSLQKETEEEKKRLQDNMQKTIAEKKRLYETEVKDTLALLESRSVAEGNAQKKKLQLEIKKEMIESVFDLALEKLDKLSESERQNHLKKLQSKLGKEFTDIYCAKQDAAVVKGTPANIKGGIIAQNKSGTERVDLSYETLLEQVKKDHMAKISKMLFG